MGFSKKFFVCAVSAMSLLAGCGDSGSSSSDNNPSNPADIPDTPSFNVSGCEATTDATIASQLETAKGNIADILKSLGEGDFHTAQAFSAQSKTIFKTVLDANPNNCEAQLGYALGIVTDLVNNKEIKEFIDTVSNKQDLVDMNVEDFNKILVASDGRLLTSMAQTAMAQAIPSLDSALIYMRSVVNNKDFTCKYTYEDRTYELDRGEFAPALGAIFVAKAVLTFGASLNIDVSDNGSYDWMNEADRSREAPALAVKQIQKMLDPKSSLTTVYDNWKPRYKDIPNLLDSAISYVELGLQYGIEESKNGTATQLNDPYIVGDGEMSDVSASDFQKAIDSLEHYRQALHTGVEVTLPRGTKLTINVAKFFEITDGFQDYLPYHHINDASEWQIPVDGFYWSDDLDAYESYVEMELERELEKQVTQAGTVDYFGAWTRSAYSWDDEEQLDYKWQVCMDIDYKNGGYAYKCFSMKLNNCTITFGETNNYYGSDDITVAVPSPIELSSNVCKVENGTPLFATAYQDAVDNIFYFTDASGKKTLSYQALENGYVEGDKLKDYDVRDFGKYIFFPDITFGGVLPGMTAEKFWDMIATESEEDDDDDWGYYPYDDEWDY